MDFTGERYVPDVNLPQISCEHWHRYLYATQFVKDKTVLDIASGEGYGSALISQTAKKVIGVDISPEAVKHASGKYASNKIEFRTGSAENIPVEGTAVFDIITSFETIEHINETAQRAFLAGVKRLLKPGGIFITSTPNKLVYTDMPGSINEFHVKEFYLDEFKDFMKGFFSNIKYMGQKIYPVSYIWNQDENDTKYTEYKLEFSGETAHPTTEPKIMMYVIAVASDAEIKEIPASILVDHSDAILKLRENKIFSLTAEKRKLHKHIENLASAYKEKQEKIKELEAKLAEKEKGK